MVYVITWIDGQNSLEAVTDAELSSTDGRTARVTTSWTWSGRRKQLYYLVNAQLVDGTKEIVRAEASKGNVPGLDPEQASGVTVGTFR